MLSELNKSRYLSANTRLEAANAATLYKLQKPDKYQICAPPKIKQNSFHQLKNSKNSPKKLSEMQKIFASFAKTIFKKLIFIRKQKFIHLYFYDPAHKKVPSKIYLGLTS